jgi:hypothetical protein
MVAKRNVYKILVRKPQGKRQLGTPRRRWNDNIKTDLREIRWYVTDWIYLAENRNHWRAVMTTVMNLPAP